MFKRISIDGEVEKKNVINIIDFFKLLTNLVQSTKLNLALASRKEILRQNSANMSSSNRNED